MTRNRKRRRNGVTFLAVTKSSIGVANLGAANWKNSGAKCSIQCTQEICILFVSEGGNFEE